MEGNGTLMMSTVLIWIAGAWGAGQIARWLALPPLVGYLTVGALFAANDLGDVNHWLDVPSEIGVELLLFAVGLKMNPKSIFRFDVAFGTLLHLMLSALILVLALTQDLSIEMKIALALTLGFSSTVVAAKGLEARRELRAFHGRLSISILVLQDLVAVTLLAIGGDSAPSPYALGLLAIPLVAPMLRKSLEKLSPEPELQLLVGVLIALVLGAQLFKAVGVSGELGALVMGMVFANHPVAKGLANYLWGIRELLLIAFFLRVGMQVPLDLQVLMDAIPLLLLLPIKLMVLFGYLLVIRLRSYTAFLMSITLFSYSEFALIVAAAWADTGLIPTSVLPVIAVAVTLSFVISAPLNRFAHELYERFEGPLTRLERTDRHPDEQPLTLGGAHVLVIGMGRIGTAVFDSLTDDGEKVVGIDADPGKLESHREAGRRVVFADAEDPGFWNNLRFGRLEAVVLTMPEPESQCWATNRLRERGFEGVIAVSTRSRHTVARVEDAGANLIYDAHDAAGLGLGKAVLKCLDGERLGNPEPR